MTDTSTPVVHQTTTQTEQRAPVRNSRPATYADINLVHKRLVEIIETSPYYSEQFKAFERARLSKDYLAKLIDINPNHVMIGLSKDQVAGFMISGPELGALWLYWSYLFPEMRRSSLAMQTMRSFVEYWDGKGFHKISTYTKPGNDVAIGIMKRYGFTETALLEKHIFGEDYLLYELPLTKTTEGYDLGIGGGIKARIGRTARRLLTR